MLMNHHVSQALQWRLSAALRETSDQGERLTLTFLWVKLAQGWAGREKSKRHPSASIHPGSQQAQGGAEGGKGESGEEAAGGAESGASVNSFHARLVCLTFARLFILHVCKQQNSFLLNPLQWCFLVWIWLKVICPVIMTVFLQLHQHRRLTRAQSHHGSEEEKKRRKILARKVGLSPTNLQTKI